MGHTSNRLLALQGQAEAGLLCFVAGTKVKTPDGDKDIEDIEVWSCDAETGSKHVTRLSVNEARDIAHVTIDGETIDATTTHPFYVEGYGFKPAGQLLVGEKVRLLDGVDGETGEVEAVAIEHLDEPVKVYNFEVEDWHTYYVAELGVLVHNMCAVVAKDNTGIKRGNETGELKNTYNSIKDSSNYPEGFQPRKNGTTRNTIKNKDLLDKLREIEAENWKKVYKDGYDAFGNEVSIHYFQSESGKVFDVKVKPGWSN